MGMELAKEVRSKVGKGKTPISQCWGTTETCGSMTGNFWGVVDDTYSVGGIFANLNLRLLDENDQDVEEGQPGELLIQGPVVFQGYHNNPEATKNAFLEGFYRTGDVGVFVKGLNYIVDRKKELIKYKGLQVAPAELEDTLIAHPKISEAAVIGVPDESAGEVPRGYVVKAANSDVTEKEIMDFVKANLATHKQLRGMYVVRSIPLTCFRHFANPVNPSVCRWCCIHQGGAKESFRQDFTQGDKAMGCPCEVHRPSESDALNNSLSVVSSSRLCVTSGLDACETPPGSISALLSLVRARGDVVMSR